MDLKTEGCTFEIFELKSSINPLMKKIILMASSVQYAKEYAPVITARSL